MNSQSKINFFILDYNVEHTYVEIEDVESLKTGDAKECLECRGAMSSLKTLTPLRVVLTRGVYGDFIFDPIGELVSQNFVNAYKSSDLKGISQFSPVEVIGTKGKKLKK